MWSQILPRCRLMGPFKMHVDRPIDKRSTRIGARYSARCADVIIIVYLMVSHGLFKILLHLQHEARCYRRECVCCAEILFDDRKASIYLICNSCSPLSNSMIFSICKDAQTVDLILAIPHAQRRVLEARLNGRELGNCNFCLLS